MQDKYMVKDNILFGQFLIEQQIITNNQLSQALKIQKRDNLSDKPKMLGSILLNEFGVFEDRMELSSFLDKFKEFDKEMKEAYEIASTYGLNPLEKLQEEYAILIKELEINDVPKIKNLIKEIEKFRMSMKDIKYKDELIKKLRAELVQLKADKERYYSANLKMHQKIKELKQELSRKDLEIKKLLQHLRKG
jgi:hypothetical protein